ncbi:M56 family metallopeptidase [Clostridium thermarum]|uniref:M56 family metallopeptidase n=1 Tax=Clostridium thermarum TaxID=1716543 RepID=UPI0013D81178|nr:M56 family metallopeptidase [Clostridium thermarum]
METLINISVATSITALIILGIKNLLKTRISPKWQFSLWIILALRLLVPVLPESKVSVLNTVPQVQKIEVVKRSTIGPIENTLQKNEAYVTGQVVIGEQNKQITFSKTLMDNVLLIWSTGSLIMLSYSTLVYLLYHKKTRRFIPAEDPSVYAVLEECKKELGISSDIKIRIGGDTPLLKGLFKPEIILPEGYTEQELKSVFMHELMHFKHKDILWSVLSTLLLCIYWYNPIMWICFKVFRRDMEILCDYRVLEVYSDRKTYASVLLKTALKRNNYLPCTTSMQNGEKDISKRIKYIAYFKKPKVLGSFIALAAAAIITIVCLTNPSQKTSPEVKDTIISSGTTLNYDELYSYKTLYVGDAGKVGSISSRLYYSQYRNGISLQTYAEPYGATINYKVSADQFSGDGSINNSDDLRKNAAIMLCLIDNVDYITFNFEDGRESRKYTFSRNALEKFLGVSTRDYSVSLEKFKEEFIPLIDKQDWSSLKPSSFIINNEVAEQVEKKLNTIMESPAASSNPADYIKAHQNEYEDILKMGDDALSYMLSLFEQREVNGLKAHVMMQLCIDLLGNRNNVKAGSYSSPEEWYSKLSPYTPAKLPAFKYEGNDTILKLVYSAALNKYSAVVSITDPHTTIGPDSDYLTIVAPKVYGTYEKGNELRIFTTVYYSGFRLYDKTITQESAGIVPAAIIYTKNNDGNYSFKDYIEAKDGADFKESIEEFCSPKDDIAKSILQEYGKHEELSKLMRENLTNYLKENNLEGISLKESSGEIVPLT